MNKSLPLITAALAGVLAAGCAGTGARRVETGGPETVTTINHIDDQDWAEAAKKATDDMLSQQGLFAPKQDGDKYVLAISRITNDTSDNVDVDLLVKQIRVTLLKSGKVVTTTIGGLTTEDPLAKQETQIDDFTNGNGSPQRRRPDYILSGKLIENQAHADNIRQSTFYFQLTLTDKNGNGVWEGDTPITKIGSHNSVGL